MLEGQFIQLVHRHVQQSRHLVDEGAGAAGAGAVHALLQAVAEEDDLGVLAAQLDDRVGAGVQGVHGLGRGVHLLHEIQAAGLGHAQSGGAGDGQFDLLAAVVPLDPVQDLAGLFAHLGKMALVGAEKQMVRFVQHHHFDRGGTDVDADMIHGHSLPL